MMNEKACYDPSAMSVSYRSEGSLPTHHAGVKFICCTDINGTYRRIDLDDIRKAFAEPNIASSGDPWKNRSAGMRCMACMFFVEKRVALIQNEDIGLPAKNRIGRCRRHAPTMNGYPVVFEDDWCGDHKLDEKK